MLKNKIIKYRPCIGRTISFSVLSFMLFFIVTVGILPNVEGKEKNIAFFLIIIFVLLHILFVFYSLLKLNSYIFIEDNKISQRQFTKIIDIKYDEITDVKLSFALYIRAAYAIKVYSNNNKILFETTSKVYDAFMNNCYNIEIKNKIERLLKEKGVY